jgi:hypothetical protein
MSDWEAIETCMKKPLIESASEIQILRWGKVLQAGVTVIIYYEAAS